MSQINEVKESERYFKRSQYFFKKIWMENLLL